MHSTGSKISITIEIADALYYECDVLCLKYAQAYHGLDGIVAHSLFGNYDPLAIRAGETLLVNSQGRITPKNVLFVGTPSLIRFGYTDIRLFARAAIFKIYEEMPTATHVALTLHGAEFGLDEREAFEAEVAGLVDAITSDRSSPHLCRITIVEINPGRAARLRKDLALLIPKGFFDFKSNAHRGDLESKIADRFKGAGFASDSKPHVFVAMPFKKETEDVYYYGIEGATRKTGFLCERADLSIFTGDVIHWIRERIRKASLVIADLTDANPNVYLEVGFAWGCNIPTVLVVRRGEELKFDVRTQRCIQYDTIKELEEALARELEGLGHREP